MTTENPTLSDHRQALQQFLRTARAPQMNPYALVPGPTAAAAIEWALEQTQEPAPPPGGWREAPLSPSGPADMFSALDSLSQRTVIEELGTINERIAFRLAIQWALPILRRAANLTQKSAARTLQADDPDQQDIEPVQPHRTKFRDDSGCLGKILNICALADRNDFSVITITSGHWTPNTADHVSVPVSEIREALRLAPAEKSEGSGFQAWAGALAALTKRELRFWKEAGEVSGTVTRRAASRAIRGLEQILKTIPADLRS